jgi:hypothetical protein
LLVPHLLVIGCVPAEPRDTAPVPPPVVAMPAPPPPLAADWTDWPRTPGDWRYERSGAVSRAVFRPAGVSLACDADRRLRLRIDGRAPAPLTVRTSFSVGTLTPGADGAFAIEANDRLLDAIVFSRGRFTLQQAGAPPLVLPPWAELGRVVEDCRG